MPPIYFIYPLVKPAASLCGYIYLLRWTLSSKPRLISASQGYGRVSFSAVWLLMPVRHKPLSRLTGCGRLIRIIAPPVPLFSATRTVGSPLYSIRGREEVSLCPCRLIAPCLLPAKKQLFSLILQAVHDGTTCLCKKHCISFSLKKRAMPASTPPCPLIHEGGVFVSAFVVQCCYEHFAANLLRSLQRNQVHAQAPPRHSRKH